MQTPSRRLAILGPTLLVAVCFLRSRRHKTNDRTRETVQSFLNAVAESKYDRIPHLTNSAQILQTVKSAEKFDQRLQKYGAAEIDGYTDEERDKHRFTALNVHDIAVERTAGKHHVSVGGVNGSLRRVFVVEEIDDRYTITEIDTPLAVAGL
ncbi:hypothetical protein L5G32_09015 [Gordonia sp. HY002]|uniref:hypothetical protein n=1 Tax=Gordonia zhenghanii TaxID=2911516 RepID=UPI001EF09771|nr:hypothetical protein [Gordonia zhenghanii]MCF8570404.1 hypothetical protein [Gordonia zhenghanii]MCF8604634.1 hypothetical protein [Gordonia zhenghanii]